MPDTKTQLKYGAFALCLAGTVLTSIALIFQLIVTACVTLTYFAMYAVIEPMNAAAILACVACALKMSHQLLRQALQRQSRC